MKTNVYYDVWMVITDETLKQKKGQALRLHADELPKCFRFVREEVQLPCLLVPGQTFTLTYDPPSENNNGEDMLVVRSGVVEVPTLSKKHFPFIIIQDDYTMSFEAYCESFGEKERNYSYGQQLCIWRQGSQKWFESILRPRFERNGWRFMESGQWKESQPGCYYK
jgi:hypothetical protein